MGEARGTSGLTIGAVASAAAAVLHATAAGVHAEQTGLARLFALLALAQLGAALVGFLRTDRWACASLFAVNAGAVGGWLLTRLVGISWIGGLEVAGRPQPADTIAALLAGVAVAAAGSCALGRATVVPGRAMANSIALAAVLLVPGLADATTHDHGDHDHDDVATDDHGDDHGHQDDGGHTDTEHADDHADDHDDSHADDHAAEAGDDGASADHGHEDGHDDEGHTSDHDGHDDDGPTDVPAWPRPWDPSRPIDFSGVDGVTAEQQARAEQLVRDTMRDLPAFADVETAAALGYHSIGDAATGFEHYIDLSLFGDGKELDPTAPESLVYRVDGDERTLVSAMFIVADTPIDDPRLTDFAGPLMQWHVHDNLCWGLDDDGQPVVKGVLATPTDACPPGSINAGAENPMVHVWITPHACGPFAALEGHGAGQASVSDGFRMDQCDHEHGDEHGDEHADDHTGTATAPYDPALPIDLGGVSGVTPEQQAFAENLVAVTLRYLPQWADLDAVEAAGFRSIGDGATGHEHYIQWDWIDDDVWLDPNYPESLVFEPQPDGTKRLVSAMYMLPSDQTLDDVPDWGGDLMQWHVHGDLCFTDEPVAPQVAGVKPIGTSCRPPLVDGTEAPMIHDWIRPHECGPFAALDGIA
ncbi:MAG: hypothetical protein ACLGHQ_16070, partial [Acidimicrobiia bacterium]